ncbi:MAG: hypothetical protein Q4G08_01870 [Capnocytophaga sp.]|nr:hypothetical protein [Capnocytophaga sp.]
MISRIFQNTKPANLLIVLAIVVGIYLTFEALLFQRFVGFGAIAISFLILLLLLVTMIVANSITHHNELTGNNSFTILFFGLMVSLFPDTYMDLSAVFANFLCTLALWRLMTLRTGKHFVQKILDASLLISFASLFVTWAIIYLLIVWISLVYFGTKKGKYWLIPFVALICVVVLYAATAIVMGFEDALLHRIDFRLDGHYSFLQHIPSMLSVATLATVLSVTMLFFITRKQPQVASSIPLVMLFLWIGLAVSLASHEFIFTFVPLSILFTIYFEQIRRAWLKESIFWLFLLMPFGVLLLHLIPER